MTTGNRTRSRNGSRWLAACLAGFMTLVCCTPKPGKAVTHESLCKAENSQQRVTLEGYLTFGGMMTFCSHGTCSLELRKQKDAAKPSVTVGIQPGSGKNRMAPLPERFGKKDLKFTTSDGTELGDLAHVRVTGKALVGEGCQLLDVDLIEAVK